MTYKGIYRDGVVVLHGDIDLREGDRVQVSPERKGESRSRSKSESKRAQRAPSRKASKSARKPVHPLIALAGIWKDRPEWKGKSTLEVLAELRTRSRPISSRAKARRG